MPRILQVRRDHGAQTTLPVVRMLRDFHVTDNFLGLPIWITDWLILSESSSVVSDYTLESGDKEKQATQLTFT